MIMPRDILPRFCDESVRVRRYVRARDDHGGAVGDDCVDSGLTRNG